MIHPETHLVTSDNGPRPAGSPHKCFYCGQEIGEDHNPTCVCRSRTVVVRAIVEYTIDVPEHWTEEKILWHRNEGSWCASNMISELDRADTASGQCLCGQVRFEYVREATEEDEQRTFGRDRRLPS